MASERNSTIDAIAEFVENIRFANHKSLSVFLDLQKAFDHKILLSKFDSYDLAGPCLNWMTSYLSSRHQCVKMNGVISILNDFKAGFIWGSSRTYSWASFVSHLH